MTPTKQPRPARPAGPARSAKGGRPTRAEAAQLEERIRLAAVEAFIERGFEGVAMEDVARAAQVSKPTLYARYPDKHAMFLAVIPWALQNLHWADPIDETNEDDLPAALLALARAAQARAVDHAVVDLLRTVIAEAGRFPELGRLAQSLAWSPAIRTAVALLQRHAATGAIRVEHLEIAAEQFSAMVSAMPALFASFGLRRSQDSEEVRLEHAVRLFLDGVLPR